MYLHPVTLIIGAIATIALVILVSIGLSCASYKLDPTYFEYFKHLFDISKTIKVC
jgi:hypothetical protein